MPQTMTGRYAGAYQLAMAGLVGPVAGVAGAAARFEGAVGSPNFLRQIGCSDMAFQLQKAG